MFILKADNTGEVIWIKEVQISPLGISGYARPFEIQVNSQSEIVLIGEFSGGVDFDPSENSSTSSELHAFGAYNNFILKLSTDGEFLWVKQIAAGSSNAGFNISDISIADNDDITVTGTYNMYLMLNSGIVLNAPTGNTGFPDHIYLMKLDNEGTLSWVKTIVPNSDYDSARLTKNSEGNTVVFIIRNTATAADETLYPYLAAEENGVSAVYRVVRFDGNGDYLEHTTIFSGTHYYLLCSISISEFILRNKQY